MIDLGFSGQTQGTEGKGFSFGPRGTPGYGAPELLTGRY